MPLKDKAAQRAYQAEWRKNHPDRRTPENSAFRSAKCRCENPRHRQFKDYGGRGIKFLFSSFDEFLAELGLRPSPQHELDRINNEGNYEKGNVRWVTRRQSLINRRATRWVTHKGRTQSLSEWCRELDLYYNTVHNRLTRGWSVERALSTPAKSNNGNADAQVGACG